MVNKKRKEKKSPLHKRRLRWCNGLGVYEKERIDGWFDGLLGWIAWMDCLDGIPALYSSAPVEHFLLLDAKMADMRV
jgi:hypothetical protein